MNKLSQVFNYVRYAQASKLFVTSAFVLALTTLVGVNVLGNQQSADAASASNRVCSSNDFIRCGTYSGGETISHIKQNKQPDLGRVFNAFGLQSSEYARFSKTARLGTAYKDGRIVVDGKVVATKAYSYGREAKSYSDPVHIAGKTYHGSYSTEVFRGNSIPVLAMFDTNGKLEFSILTACGNPIVGQKVVPRFNCTGLKKTAVAGKKNTYVFNSSAMATNNASIVKVVYNFGDGTPTVTQLKPSYNVQHTYTKVGKFTAKVSVYIALPGGQTRVIESAVCTTPVEVKPVVKPPVLSCDALRVTPITTTEVERAFTSAVTAKDGATLAKVVYNFGDGSAEVSQTNPATVVKHTYAPGTYTARVTAHITVAGKVQTVTNDKCTAPIKVVKEVVPVIACDALKVQPITTSTQTTRTFNSTVTATGGATLTKVVYNFGDASAEVSKTTAAEAVTHTYAPGTYTARVTAHFLVNGVAKTATNEKCTAPIKVTEKVVPLYECTELTVITVNKEKREYKFTVKASAQGGATLKDADFNFGDTQTATGIKPTDTATVSTSHTFAEAKKYTIVATVNFNVADGVQSKTCQVEITPEKDIEECPEKPGSGLPVGHPDCKKEECKPGIPVGDDRCKECKPGIPMNDDRCYECKPGVPANDKQCEELPAVLPKTGQAEVIGGAIGLSSVAGAGYYYLGSRRNLLGTLLNKR